MLICLGFFFSNFGVLIDCSVNQCPFPFEMDIRAVTKVLSVNKPALKNCHKVLQEISSMS